MREVTVPALDRSNGQPLALFAAALLAAWRRPALRPLFATAALGWLFALGPWLKLGERALPIPPPFHWLGELHPALDRLSWPERWGTLVTLGLAGAAAGVARPAPISVLVLLEAALRSGNLPLQAQDLSDLERWRDLRPVPGTRLLDLAGEGIEATGDRDGPLLVVLCLASIWREPGRATIGSAGWPPPRPG